MDIQRKKKPSQVSALILFCVLFVLFFFYNSVQGFYQPYKSLLTSPNSNNSHTTGNQATNILFLGVDESDSGKHSFNANGRTDFMMLLSLNPETKKITALSIPRDTKLDEEIFGASRINSINTTGGVNQVKLTVERLLNLKVDNYVLININGFKRVMDSVGDVKVYVPKKMQYEDHKAGLDIDFHPGLKSMNSEELLDFLRYRDDEDGDIGRIKRQMIFFRSILYSLKAKELLVKLPYLLNSNHSLFLTDLKENEAVSLVRDFSEISEKNFQSYILPGDFAKNGYWKIDYPEMNRLVEYIKQNS